MNDYLKRQDIAEVFAKNERGLRRVFKFFCKQQKQERLDDKIPFMLEHMHFKQFVRLCMQTKIIPTLCTIDDVNNNFKNIVIYYRTPGFQTDGTFSPFIDYDTFKRALVRLGLLGKDHDATVNREEIEEKMREEFVRETNNALYEEEDFKEWMKDQEAQGNGLKDRIKR